MLTRRIATSACALCLIVPALAGAQPIHDVPAATPTNPQSTAGVMGPSGTTNPTSPRNTAGVMGPSGTTNPTSPRNTAGVMGPSGTTNPTSPRNTAGVMGPSGTTNPTSPRNTAGVMGPSGTTKAAARAAVASDSDGTDGWRTAAVSEAALFAALALGAALILRARRAAPRMGM
jgi:hypothetical protein